MTMPPPDHIKRIQVTGKKESVYLKEISRLDKSKIRLKFGSNQRLSSMHTHLFLFYKQKQVLGKDLTQMPAAIGKNDNHDYKLISSVTT